MVAWALLFVQDLMLALHQLALMNAIIFFGCDRLLVLLSAGTGRGGGGRGGGGNGVSDPGIGCTWYKN